MTHHDVLPSRLFVYALYLQIPYRWRRFRTAVVEYTLHGPRRVFFSSNIATLDNVSPYDNEHNCSEEQTGDQERRKQWGCYSLGG